MKYLPTRYHFHYCEWFGSKRSVISIRFVMSQFLNTWLFVSLVLVIKIAKCGLRKSWKWVSISFFTCIENRPGKCSFLRNPILKVGHSNFWSRRTSQLTFLTTCQMKLWHLSGTFGEKLRHFPQTLHGEALLGKFPNLSGEPEISFRFCPESGESEIFRFLGILRSNSPLEIHIKKFYIKMLFLKKKILNLEVIFE